MNTILFLRTGTDAVLFSEELQHIPQPGDLVTYSFEAHDKGAMVPGSLCKEHGCQCFSL